MNNDRLSCSGCDHHTDNIRDALGHCSHCKRAYRSEEEQNMHDDLYTDRLRSARAAYVAAGYTLD